MSAVWGAAVILEKFFGNMHIVHLQNIGENGRIVVDKGRKEMFFLCFLHYNDTCKVNQSFTVGECKVIKLNILNMKNFLDTVNSCTGKVNMLCPDCLRLVLEIPGFCLLEKRFVDVTIRYGVHPATIDRWKKILEIKERFENQIGCSIYALLPGVVENSFR